MKKNLTEEETVSHCDYTATQKRKREGEGEGEGGTPGHGGKRG